MKRILFSLAIALLLTSCSASWHIRKAQKKDPSLFTTETVKVVDTLYVEVPKIEFKFKYKTDTVTLTKDSVRIKYYHSVRDSTVYVEADCPPNKVITNTVTKTNTVFVKPTLKEQLGNFLRWLVYLAILGFIVWAAVKIFGPLKWRL